MLVQKYAKVGVKKVSVLGRRSALGYSIVAAAMHAVCMSLVLNCMSL